MKLAELLSDHRWAKKMSLEKLATAIGLTRSALFRFEHGKPLDQQNLNKILRWLFS